LRNVLSRIYRPAFGLLTDLYQLTMAYGYWRQGLHDREAVFHLFYRRAPFDGHYAFASGLETALDLLENFRFEAEDVQYLGGLRDGRGQALFPEPFLNYLQRMRFTGKVEALPEGSPAYPFEPMLQITAPLLQAQLIETALLNIINFSTLITTKAARIVAAAQGDPVVEFGLRRAQGIDGGLTASRAAYIGGAAGTSNVWAGRFYGIPVKGTHAHSWVMVYGDELASFRAYAEAFPGNCIFLVDTYDTLEGVRNAIRVGRELRQQGYEMNGIRLDSGDLGELSKAARQLLDAAGFPEVSIVASNDLDEYRIRELKNNGARIGVWGVGTRLATAYDQPALGGVYKLAALRHPEGYWQYRLKKSEQLIKINNPGRLQVRRYRNAAGVPAGSILYDPQRFGPLERYYTHSGEGPCELPADWQATDALVTVMEEGQRTLPPVPIDTLRQRVLDHQAELAAVDWPAFVGGLEENLYHRKRELLADL
jgi:nicotinate phosphoribosyltransferase